MCRFEGRKRRGSYGAFKTHVRTQLLSPYITYRVNLVFKFRGKRRDFLGLWYKLAGETRFSNSFVAQERGDGWLMVEFCQFISNTENVDLQVKFYCVTAIEVEGIEFQPLERVRLYNLDCLYCFKHSWKATIIQCKRTLTVLIGGNFSSFGCIK